MLRLKKVNYRARLTKRKSALSPELEREVRKISQMLNAPLLSGPFILDRESRKEEFAKQLAERDNTDAPRKND